MGFIIDDIIKGIGAKKAAKEQNRAQNAEAQGQFESDTKANDNAEQSRQGRAQALISGLGGLYGGKYAGLLGDTSHLTGQRQNIAFKHAVADPSKGVMWNAAGNAVNSLGNLALAAATGGMSKVAQSAAGAVTSLRNPNGSAPMSADDQWNKFGQVS